MGCPTVAPVQFKPRNGPPTTLFLPPRRSVVETVRLLCTRPLVLYLQQFQGASMRANGTQLFQSLYLWIRPILVFNEPKEKSHALRGKARTRLCELFAPSRHEEPIAGDSTSVIFTPTGPLVYSWQIDCWQDEVMISTKTKLQAPVASLHRVRRQKGLGSTRNRGANYGSGKSAFDDISEAETFRPIKGDSSGRYPPLCVDP
jgi:hypothetical protein